MRLASMFSSASSNSGNSAPPPGDSPASTGNADQEQPFGLGSLATVLPPLMQALSGHSDLVKPEKLNLVRAIKPYLSDGRSPGVDRAIRMANVALAAKSALSLLGR